VKLPALLLAAALLAAAPAAQAATWKQVTASGGSNIDQVGLARTPDGVLHVIWHTRTGPNTEDVLHTAISPAGKIGATSPIQSGWASLTNAALTVVPGGLRAVWGGIRTIDPNEPNVDLNTALSTDGGASWALSVGSIIPRGAQAYGSPSSATTLPGGTVLESWAGTLGTWVHSGLDPAAPNFEYQAPMGNYGYYPGIAADASGAAMIAWYSNATGHLGVFARGVNADGSPAGPALNMPSTADMNVGQISRTPIVARARGGGFYVAYATGYPTQDEIRVWRVGAAGAPLLGRTAANSVTALAADPKGRLWVAWTAGTFGSKRILARRSNRSATVWGATVNAGAVKGTSSAYDIDASATASSLDLLGLFFKGAESSGATYHARINPGLTLTAARSGKRVRYTVTDAGDPVRGAKVRAAGRSGTPDGRGRVTLTLKQRTKATASAPGYVSATVKR
jgi:hypothetical protein